MEKQLMLKNTINNMVFQLIEMLADKVAHRVVEKLKGSETIFAKTIEVEAKTVGEENPQELLSIQEVCEILKVKRGTLNSWRVKGVLKPDTHVGNSPRYFRVSIDEFINLKK